MTNILGSCFQMIKKHMTNCIEEIFYNSDEWLDSKFATYGNIKNTFTGGKYKPVTYDYIFHKSNHKNKTYAWTNWFNLTLFKTVIPEILDETRAADFVRQSEYKFGATSDKSKRSVAEKTISLSDHEGVESVLHFWI